MEQSVPDGVRRVHADVYDVTCAEGKGRRYRTFLFDDDVPTLIDTSHREYAETMIERIDALGIVPERLLITHTDTDHIAAFDPVVDRYGLETWLPEDSDVETAHQPDRRFSDGDAIGPFDAVAVPGHAPSHYVFVDRTRGIAVLGDALVGSDVRGLPPGFFVLPPAVWSVDLHLAERSLEPLLSYEFEIGLVYHGSSVLEDAAAKLDRFVNFPQERV